MEKTSKKKVTVHLPKVGKGRILSGFPLPPFVTQEVDLSPLQSFSRAALAAFRYVVIVTQGDILATLEAFFLYYPLREKKVFLCASGDEAFLAYLHDELPREETVFLFVARRPEEFWGLFPFFALQDRKRVLVGEPHGAFAECARECFVPFLPVDIPCFSFWHRSAFLYLPLSLWGIAPEVVERGFREGYAALREVAFRAALLVSQKLEEKDYMYVVVDTPLLEKVTHSFVPLLEECLGKRGLLRVVDGKSLWKERDELLQSVVLFVRGYVNEKLQARIPQALFPSSGVSAQRGFLRRYSFSDVRDATMEVLQSFLRTMQENLLSIELFDLSPFLLGQYMAFLQCFACYGAWLRGVDIFSDPPLVQLERSIVSFLGRRDREDV